MDTWKWEIQDKQPSEEFNQEVKVKMQQLFDRGPKEIFSLGSAFGSGLAGSF